MTNKDMLDKIRKDRPDEVIHSVISFEENELGHYNVTVEKEGEFLGKKDNNQIAILPYPRKEFENMSTDSQNKWISTMSKK